MLPAVSVALLPCELPKNWSQNHQLAVVIDTLRFTSTACVALAAGARSLRVVSNIDQAKSLAAALAAAPAAAGSSPPPGPLLCGERNCVRIAGFDLGNSPAEYTPSIVEARDLIFSTTNGTAAVEAVADAKQVLLGALLNRNALVRWILHWAEQQPSGQQPDEAASVWLVCAGTDGQVALEDVITAGAILEQLDWNLANDSAWLAFTSWHHIKHSGSLLKQLQLARGGANLVAAGFAEDIKAALHVDALNVVPGQTERGRFEVLTLN